MERKGGDREETEWEEQMEKRIEERGKEGYMGRDK